MKKLFRDNWDFLLFLALFIGIIYTTSILMDDPGKEVIQVHHGMLRKHIDTAIQYHRHGDSDTASGYYLIGHKTWKYYPNYSPIQQHTK